MWVRCGANWLDQSVNYVLIGTDHRKLIRLSHFVCKVFFRHAAIALRRVSQLLSFLFFSNA